MTIYGGRTLAFGSKPELLTIPIVNLPPDTIKVRRRIRAGQFPMVFVKTPARVSCHLIEEVEQGLALIKTPRGVNQTDPR